MNNSDTPMALDNSRNEPERYSCPSCSKTFVRKAHMLRHQQQHASQKPFHCSFCSKCFKRSDVLRAHQFRCKERGDAPVPEGQSKGRKRSSCASCVKLRTKCDQETPCGRCQELGKECVRDTGNGRNSAEARPRRREAIPIHHLLNNPPNDDFSGRFPVRDLALESVDEEDDTNLVDNENSSEASHWSEEYDPYDPYVGADVVFESFFGGLETLTFGQHPLEADALPLPPTAESGALDAMALALEPRAAEIKLALHETARILKTLPEVQHLNDLNPAIDHLTGAEINLLLNLYFKNYHKHCPIIHRPSFRPTLCPLPLLLSTMALGGMYSPDDSRVQWMRSLLDVIEAYIFSLPGIRDEYTGSLNLAEAPNEEMAQSNFEQLQGAYLLIVAQYFSGNLSAKRRARRQRFSRVIEIARSFRLPITQHGAFVAIPDEASFQNWIRQESRIRLMNIILTLDAAMAIFNNVAPRVPFSEIDLQLPCDAQYFELSSHQEMVTRSTFPKPKMQLLDAFQKLFVPSSEIRTLVEKDFLNTWDMMILVHCLYSFVWWQTFTNPLFRSAQPMPGSTIVGAILEPCKTAVRNWKMIWDDIRINLSREAVAAMGFESSADSYWTLTKLMLHRFDPKSSMGAAPIGSVNGNSYGHHGNESGTVGDNGGAMIDFKSSSDVGVTGDWSLTGIDFMPLETDCDSQGAHLRRILKKTR